MSPPRAAVRKASTTGGSRPGWPGPPPAPGAPCTLRRARLASWRTAVADRPITRLISSNGYPKTSCSTKAALSAGARVVEDDLHGIAHPVGQEHVGLRVHRSRIGRNLGLRLRPGRPLAQVVQAQTRHHGRQPRRAGRRSRPYVTAAATPPGPRRRHRPPCPVSGRRSPSGGASRRRSRSRPCWPHSATRPGWSHAVDVRRPGDVTGRPVVTFAGRRTSEGYEYAPFHRSPRPRP